MDIGNQNILLENINITAPQSCETERIIFNEEPSHVLSCETEGISNAEKLNHMIFIAPREGTEDPFWESKDLSFYGVPADLEVRSESSQSGYPVIHPKNDQIRIDPFN